jgi:hypothetical protein
MREFPSAEQLAYLRALSEAARQAGTPAESPQTRATRPEPTPARQPRPSARPQPAPRPATVPLRRSPVRPAPKYGWVVFWFVLLLLTLFAALGVYLAR